MQDLAIAAAQRSGDAHIARAQKRDPGPARRAIEEIAQPREGAGFAGLVGAVDDMDARLRIELQPQPLERAVALEGEVDEPHASLPPSVLRGKQREIARLGEQGVDFAAERRGRPAPRNAGLDRRQRRQRLRAKKAFALTFVEQGGQVEILINLGAAGRGGRPGFDQQAFERQIVMAALRRRFDFQPPMRRIGGEFRMKRRVTGQAQPQREQAAFRLCPQRRGLPPQSRVKNSGFRRAVRRRCRISAKRTRSTISRRRPVTLPSATSTRTAPLAPVSRMLRPCRLPG